MAKEYTKSSLAGMALSDLRKIAKGLGVNVSGKAAPDLVREILKKQAIKAGKGTAADPKAAEKAKKGKGKKATGGEGGDDDTIGEAEDDGARAAEEDADTDDEESDDEDEPETLKEALKVIASLRQKLAKKAKKVDKPKKADEDDDEEDDEDDDDDEGEGSEDGDEDEELEFDEETIDKADLEELTEIAKQINTAEGKKVIKITDKPKVLRAALKEFLEEHAEKEGGEDEDEGTDSVWKPKDRAEGKDPDSGKWVRGVVVKVAKNGDIRFAPDDDDDQTIEYEADEVEECLRPVKTASKKPAPRDEDEEDSEDEDSDDDE